MTLYVINPNSTVAVTQGIDDAIARYRRHDASIDCVTLAEGPPGIETDAHVADVVQPLLDLIDKKRDATGFVIACFSDPGLDEIRAVRSVPVVGIREASVEMALRQGDRFGVVAMGAASIRRHLAAFERLGVMDRLAGDRALGLSVTQLADEDLCAARMVEVATELRDLDGADVLVMGCAGMVGYRNRLEDATGLPVIEPCQAAVALALSQIKTHT